MIYVLVPQKNHFADSPYLYDVICECSVIPVNRAVLILFSHHQERICLTVGSGVGTKVMNINTIHHLKGKLKEKY